MVDDADALFERVVEAAMQAHGWSRERAEAMAGTVVRRPGGRLGTRIRERRPTPPLEGRRRAFQAAQARTSKDDASLSPSRALPRQPVAKPRRLGTPAPIAASSGRPVRAAQLRRPANATPIERPLQPDAGSRRPRGRAFLQGGGPGLGRRR